jgi:thymidylate synthase
MITADRSIVAPDVSSAWVDALAHLLDAERHAAVNLVLRIEHPLQESVALRKIADQLLADLKIQEIHEVANTIFPREWAADLPNAAELAADYREHYSLLRRVDKANLRGTYFGRLVAYPGEGDDTIDQLTENVRKLSQGRERDRVYGSIYQFNVYHPAKDLNVSRGFPCLAHVGMHVDGEGRLNATAQYRSHDVVSKGYGNYLGLGGLLGYVAQAAQLPVGELLVIAGGAFLSGSVRTLQKARPTLEAAVSSDQTSST